jgi:electron transport complex protein RnfB
MIAFLILGIIGIVLGILLVIASKYLYVEEDTRVEEVTKLLPGYNCGACGFPGCSGFADAIVNGKVDRLNHCKPGKEDKNFKPILEFLKQSDEEIDKKLKLK